MGKTTKKRKPTSRQAVAPKTAQKKSTPQRCSFKRALVTGGAGFIGSHLCEELIERGVTVDVIDDLSTGSTANIEHLLPNNAFHLVKDSILNEQTVTLLAERCDIVFHLAAAVGVELIVADPVRTIETNIRGSEVVLETANRFNTKVVLASTSEICGKSEAVPFGEEDDSVLGATVQSRWSYACSKMIDEFLALAYHRQFGLPVVIVRPFNTIGPRQTGQYGMVVPRFVRAALRGEPIRVFGTGQQTRSFVYVKDLVEALLKLAEEPRAVGGVFNLGSDREITILDLAKTIKRLTKSDSKIVLVPYEKAYGQKVDDLKRRVPDLTKVKRLIGFERTTSLEETLKIVIESIRTELQN
jgi:UDP-glucose 4-epimerase